MNRTVLLAFLVLASALLAGNFQVGGPGDMPWSNESDAQGGYVYIPIEDLGWPRQVNVAGYMLGDWRLWIPSLG